MPDTYSLKQNAVRAARKAIADGSAPAPTYEIKGAAGGGFRIVWDTAETSAPADLGVNDPEAVEARYTERQRNGPADQQPVTKAKTVARLAKVTELLQRPEGATIAEIQAITGWLPHTTRAFISVQIRRKAGFEVTTDKIDGRGRVYRVAA